MAFFPFVLYIRDRWVWIPLVGVVVTQIFIWWNLVANIRPEVGQIFLHYNIIFGVDLVGDWWQIFYLPAVGIFVLLLNYLLSAVFYSFDKFLARLLAIWTLFFHLFLLASIIFLVQLNS